MGSSSSDPDPELEGAIDAFLDWARAERLLGEIDELPDPSTAAACEDVARRAGDEASFALMACLRASATAEERYRFVREIARGGMGAVLRVRDEQLRRDMAMKVMLRPGEGEEPRHPEPRLLARFIDEAQITGQLDHPGVVPVHELGVDAEGHVYFTMRLVRGENLGRVISRVHEGRGEWSLTRALGVLLRICETMSYAHDMGVVHRDLKPANVMVGRHGEVYVMDWGLARVLRVARDRDQPAGRLRVARRTQGAGEAPQPEVGSPLLTKPGDVIGTPPYMSPEQAEGRLDELGPAGDVYAVGAMLYHLLAGQPPYHAPGESPSNELVLDRVRGGPPRPIHSLAPSTPPELVAICEMAMARRISDRYAGMSDLAEDLRAYLEDRVVQAHRTGAVVELRKWVARNRMLAATLLAALTSIVVGSGAAAMVLRASNADAVAARNEALSAQSLYLAALARERVDSGDPATGMLLALEALPRDPESGRGRPYLAQAEEALYAAFSRAAADDALPIGSGLPDVARVQLCPADGGVFLFEQDDTALVRNAAGEVCARLPHGGVVVDAAFGADGRRIVTTADDGFARLWSAAGELWTVVPHVDVDVPAALSGDAELLLSLPSDWTYALWDGAGREVSRVTHGLPIRSAALSHDGERVLLGCADGTARLWTAAGRELAVFVGHAGEITSVAFREDGDYALTGSRDGLVCLWSLAGRELLRLRSDGGEVLLALFRPGGGHYLTLTADRVARLWNESGEIVALPGGGDPLIHAAFSPSGSHVVMVTASRSVRVSPVLSTAELVERARRRATRSLTPAERDRFFLGPARPL
ncbi:MAG: serine/threonine-protein kinase [Planctomycetota bacterium]